MRALLLICLALAMPAGPVQAQSRDEHDYVVALFRQMQPLSFAKEVEVCGSITRDETGALGHTGPFAGTEDSCAIGKTPRGQTAIASWHTHGLFLPGYYNELPSGADVDSDHGAGVNGWVATPGGRLWFVDGERKLVKQMCGAGCLPVSPGYEPIEGKIAKGYDFDDLMARLEQ